MEENKTPIRKLPPRPIPPKKVEPEQKAETVEQVTGQEIVVEQSLEVIEENQAVEKMAEDKPEKEKKSKGSKKGRKSKKGIEEASAEAQEDSTIEASAEVQEEVTTETTEETVKEGEAELEETELNENEEENTNAEEEAQTLENNEQNNEVKQNKENASKTKAEDKAKIAKKTKKTKKHKKISKKALIIIIASIFLVLALGGGITAIVLVNQANNRKLATPVLTYDGPFDGGEIVGVLKTNVIEGATCYQFELTYLSGDNEKKVIETTTNYKVLEEAFSAPGEYSVRARVLGRGPGATSDYSETITFVNKHKLASPSVSVKNLDSSNTGNKFVTNSLLTDDHLYWHVIPNTTKYVVRYGADLENLEPKSLTVEVVDEIPENANETEVVEVLSNNGVIKFDLNNIYKNGTGVYRVSVIAVATSQYYIDSLAEKTVTIEYYAQSTKPENATYDKATKTLTFTMPESGNYGNEFEIEIRSSSGRTYHSIFVNEEDITKLEGSKNVTISVELSGFNITQNVIEMKIRTIKNNQFSTDSEFANVTLN